MTVGFPGFVTKFGADFTKSLMKPTGKYDGAGNPMCVWQDYVAGTDHTDPDDKFTASITMDKDGKITVSYSPEFTDANEKALRVYTTYGKKSLTEKDWVVVPTGSEAKYNFFKVTVEMKCRSCSAKPVITQRHRGTGEYSVPLCFWEGKIEPRIARIFWLGDDGRVEV